MSDNYLIGRFFCPTLPRVSCLSNGAAFSHVNNGGWLLLT